MDPIFNDLPPDVAMQVQLASRVSYEAREHRRMVLAAAGVADEAALLEDIVAARVAEHPAYEHYVAARILAQTHAVARQAITTILDEVNRP